MRALSLFALCLSLACTPSRLCGPASCNGCCKGDTCVAMPTAASCGLEGADCATCGAGLTCVSGACADAGCAPNCFVYPPCTAASCPKGCCTSDGTCLPGTTGNGCGKGG